MKIISVTVLDDLRCLYPLLRNLREQKREISDVKIDFEIVFNIDKLESVPSMALKACADSRVKINFGYGTDILNYELKVKKESYDYMFVLEQTTLPKGHLVQAFKSAYRQCPDSRAYIFHQEREDGQEYGNEFGISIGVPTKAAGVLDFGQILFGITYMNMNNLYFAKDFAASGHTIEQFKLEQVGPEVLFNYVITCRGALRGSSTSSKPKLVCKQPLEGDPNKVEQLLQNQVTEEEGASITVSKKVDEAYSDELQRVMIEGTATPFVSVFTSAYNIGERIYQTYESLKAQTLVSWEWVIVNDSQDGGRTQLVLENIASQDSRVKVYQFTKPTRGNIGEAKFRAAAFCKGGILAELDHDDLLAPECLHYIVKAAQKYPDAGFFYSDCTEVDQYYNCPKYPEGFALGYGSYRKERVLNMDWEVQNTVPTNPFTIRHIVGVPNHIRAWRREVYHQLLYNNLMRIADDYELIVRTFLITKFCRIPKLLYYQRFDGNNSQDNGNRQDIQYRVKAISTFYRGPIKERFKELGKEDYVDQNLDNFPELWMIPHPKDKNWANVNYTYEENS